MMRFLSTAFYMLLSILGLSVISLAALIGVQYFRGKVSGRELHSVLRVIGGTERVMIPETDYQEYLTFKKDKEKARAELDSNRGLPDTREPAAMRAQEAQTALRDNLDVYNRLLDNSKAQMEQLRREVDTQKAQVESLKSALDDEREKNAIVDRDAATAKLRKTLSEMDAGDIAAFLTQVVRDPSQGGPTEAARIMRDHLKADYSAEVLGEMPVPERQMVIPLLENRFAGVPPQAVVKVFNDQKMNAGEIIIYLSQMNPSQALGVYLRLPPSLQEQISPRILRGT